MGITVLGDGIGARHGLVGQHAPAGGPAERLQHLLREALRVGGQGIRGHDAGDLPMADGGVLAHGGLGQLAVGALGGFRRAQELQTLDVAQAAGQQDGIAISVGLTLLSGLIPSSSAAKKDPVVALRTE